MRALVLALGALSLAGTANAEALWCTGAAPPAGVSLSEGRRVVLAPGEEGPACVNVPLPAYRKPFPMFCAAKPEAAAGAWCKAGNGSCGRLAVTLSRYDKGRLATATDVRYCASFVNRSKRPVTVLLARPAGG